MIGQSHERGGADAGAEVENPAGAVADRRAEQHGIEAGAEAFCRLGEHQPPAQKGVMCDFGAFYNCRAVG